MRHLDEVVKPAGIGSTLLNTGLKALNSSAGRKALTGAAVGAGMGALTAQPDANGQTHRFRNALTGAALGGATGAAVNGIQNMGTVTPQGISQGVKNIGNKVSGAFNSFINKSAFEELDEMVKEANLGLSLQNAGMKAKMGARLTGIKVKMIPARIRAKRYAKKHPEQSEQQNANQQSTEQQSTNQSQGDSKC